MEQPFKDELMFNAFYSIFRRKWLIVSTFVLVLIGTIFMTSLLTPRYDGTAQIMVDLNPRYQVVLFPGFAQPSARMTSLDPTQNLAEFLTNRSTADAAVEEFKLDALLKHRREESTETRDVFKRSIKGIVNSLKSVLSGIGIGEGPQEKSAEWYREQAVNEFLSDWNRVEVERDTSIINITILGPDPEIAARICAWMIERLKDHVRQHARDKFLKMQDFAAQRLTEADRDLQTASVALKVFLEEEDPAALEKERDLLLAQQSAVRSDLIDARSGLEGARSRLAELRKQLEGQEEFLATSEEVEARNPVVINMKNELKTLETQMAGLAYQLKEDHPTRKELQEKINKAREILEQEMVREFQSVTRIEGVNPIYVQTMTQVADAVAQETVAAARAAALETHRQEIEARVADLSSRQASRESQRRDLDRKVRAAESHYLSLEKSALAMEALSESPEGEYDLEVVDPVHNPDGEEASTPAWDMVYPVAFFVAVFFALFLAFFMEYWRSTYRASWELEAETGSDVLVTVPRIRKLKI